jgi:hypothetical protein
MKKIIILIISILLYANEPNIYKGDKSYMVYGVGIIKDNLTGLIWQANYSDRLNHEEAIKYCQNLTLGGFTDWELPDIDDIYYLRTTKNKRFIDTRYFKIKPHYYWAKQIHKKTKDYAWSMDWEKGSNDWNNRKNTYLVRCVKTENRVVKKYKKRFIRANQIVIDNKSGLSWQDKKITPLNHQQAIEYCANDKFGGYNDWRLPNRFELMSIIKRDRVNPHAFKIFVFQYSDWYWSVDLHDKYKDKAWMIGFNNGQDNYTKKTMKLLFRCVRG